ncbi:MAG: response regulator [bacterium]
MAQILIMEDDIQTRQMLIKVLKREGYDVRGAPDGKVGIELLREKSANIVITDLIMPEKEGIETIIELQRDFAHIKIIVISGGGRIGPDNYFRILKNIGIQYTFRKPLKIEELLTAVNTLSHEIPPQIEL